MLRLIQEKAVRRIGGTREIPINTRIITATNKNLEDLVGKQTFRKDFYYRISVLSIHIPPLNQRIDDIPLLVEHFLFDLAPKLEKSIIVEAFGDNKSIRQTARELVQEADVVIGAVLVTGPRHQNW